MSDVITKADLIAQSIDFAEQFTGSVKTLSQMLGVSRLQAMPIGSNIKIYKSTVTLKSGAVAEGEEIPLSKVERKVATTVDLTFNKYRKQTDIEAIQSSGFKAAVLDTDSQILRELQKGIKKDLFTFLGTGTGSATGANFQAALGNALGQLVSAWEDEDVQAVAFVNPVDFYSYLGSNPISTQTAFGLTYVENYMGVGTVILSNAVPSGKIYATVSQNINVAYASASGQLSQAVPLTTDELGLIAVSHDFVQTNASYETLAFSALKVFPERLDGIVVATIGGSASPK